MGDDAASAESALFSLRRIRPLEGKEQTSAKSLRAGDFRQHRQCVFPPALTFAGGRKAAFANRLRGVAMATFEETNRSGRKICTMRHFRRVAMDHPPWVLIWRAARKRTMANRVGRAPGRQCGLGFSSGGVDWQRGNTANVRETPARRAVLCDSFRILSRRYSPALAERRPKGGGKAGRRCNRGPAGVGAPSGEKRRSWPTNAAASHVGSVALVF